MPGPVGGGTGILVGEAAGKFHPPPAFGQVRKMEGTNPGEVVFEEGGQRGRKHSDPILVALPPVDGDLMALKIEVLHPE